MANLIDRGKSCENNRNSATFRNESSPLYCLRNAESAEQIRKAAIKSFREGFFSLRVNASNARLV